MNTPHVTAAPAARKTNHANPRAAVLAAMPKHLRVTARAVDRLNAYRNPEAFAEAKSEIAATLTSLAVLLEVEQTPTLALPAEGGR